MTEEKRTLRNYSLKVRTIESIDRLAIVQNRTKTAVIDVLVEKAVDELDAEEGSPKMAVG